MNPKTINAIRDLSLSFEEKNLQVAYELMGIAYKERPKGPFIKKKFLEYKNKLAIASEENVNLLSLLKSGEIAIVPIGFRCHTKRLIKNKLGFSQPSLPFDSGFFPPFSIASVFYSPNIALNNDDSNTYGVCEKHENHQEDGRGRGVKFELSSYEEIDDNVSLRKGLKVNRYLDSTFGYYTLDKKHRFVLAHYNWHLLAGDEKSNGIKEPKYNIPIINDILNKRIKRMLDMCNKASYVFFIYQNNDGNFMKIDDDFFDLTDYSDLESCLNSKYKFKYSILNTKDICAKDMLDKFYSEVEKGSITKSSE